MIELLITAWVASAIGTAGFVCAESQRRWPRSNSYASYRESLGFGLAFGSIPFISLVFVFLATGFGQYGWTLSFDDGGSK